MSIKDGIVYFNDWTSLREYSGNNHNAIISGNVTIGSDSFGSHIYFNWNRNGLSWTWIRADMDMWSFASFTQGDNFSRVVTFKVDTLQPNSQSGVFANRFRSWVHLENANGVMNVFLRWSSTETYIVGSNYRQTRLWETHTVGMTYVAADAKFYVYLDWVLQNVWWTAWPATFTTDDIRRMGDNAIWSWDASSCQKYIYSAYVYNRVLSTQEHMQIWLWLSKKPQITNDTFIWQFLEF